MDPDVAEIRQQQNSGGDTSGGSGDGGGGSLSLDGLGLSKKHLALIGAAVLIALVLWKLSGDDSSSGSGAEDMDEVLNGDLSTEATVEDEESEDETQLTIPADAPQDQKDAAILGYLEETGRIGGSS